MSNLIDRQAAIEIVERYNKSHMLLKHQPMLGAASIIIELNDLPSAQPEPQWIPCSERLPEELTEVNVTNRPNYCFCLKDAHADVFDELQIFDAPDAPDGCNREIVYRNSDGEYYTENNERLFTYDEVRLIIAGTVLDAQRGFEACDILPEDFV